jgi:predicted lipid-binding transport protein (Tim44 family)
MDPSPDPQPVANLQQVHEPNMPGGAVSATSDPAGPGRWHRLRRGLAVGLAVIVLLCLGGAGAAFVYYDRATKPDRRTPVLATQEFLTAYLANRDDVRAAEYQCADTSGLSEIKAFRDDINRRQKENGSTITILVNGVYELSRSGDNATVEAGLQLLTTIEGTEQTVSERWEFRTHNEDGWRVCAGHDVT